MVAACLDPSKGSCGEKVGRAPRMQGRPHLAGKIRKAFMEEVGFKDRLGQNLDCRKNIQVDVPKWSSEDGLGF